MPLSNDVSEFPAVEIPGIAGRAAKSGGVMFIAKSVRFGFLFLVNFILINLLLPADFGMMRYVMLFVGIAGLLNEMGLSAAIVQKERLDVECLWSLFCISSLWGFTLYWMIFFSAAPISRYFSVSELTPLLRVGALIIPAAGVSTVQRALMRRRMEYGKIAIIETSAAAISAVASITLALAGFGVWALVAGYLLFEGVISIAVLIVCRIPITRFQSFNSIRSTVFFGIAIVVSRIIDYVLCNAPFFLIGKWIGREGLGLFSVARDLAVFPQMAVNAVLGHVLLSAFSRIQNDEGKTAAGLSGLLLLGSVITMPVLLLMAVYPYEILKVICIVKKESAWLEAAPLLRWLALMGITCVFTTFSGSIWIARGKVVESIAVSVAITIATIAAVIAGKRFGLTGVCIALFLQTAAVFPPYVYVNYLLTRVPVRLFFSSLAPSLVCGAAMAAVLLAAGRLTPANLIGRHFAVLFGGGLAGVSAYAVMLLLFFRSSIRRLLDIMRLLGPQASGRT